MNDAAPDIEKLNARLVAETGRIGRFLDSLANHVDWIVAAAQDEDWGEVQRQSAYLADGGAAYGYSELALVARRLCDEMAKTHSDLDIRRAIVRLVGACGRMERTAASHDGENAPT
jgi:hypothetical protein